MEKPLLSIYIPTYNRSYYLRKCLEAITEQEIFQNTSLIEIFISDNGSSDKTGEISQYFVKKYGDKIKYICRKPTVSADRNIMSGVEEVTGEYIKLCNDNLIFNNGALKEIIDILQDKSPDMLFLLNKCYRKKDPKEISACDNIDDFINSVTFFCTSIASYIYKTDKVLTLPDLYRKEELKLTQVDIALRLMDKGSKAIILNSIVFYMLPLFNKGGYNVAQIFGENYFSLLEEYVQKGSISKKTFYNERMITLKKHIIPNHFDLKRKFAFERCNFLKYMHHCYKDIHFYKIIAKIPLQLLIRNLKVLDKKLTWNYKKELKKYQKDWRDLNPNNDTEIANIFEPLKVFVGRNTKGTLNVIIQENFIGELLIGNNVIIEDNVKFIIKDEDIVIPDNMVIKSGTTVTKSLTCDII